MPKNFEAILTVLDKASEPLRRIDERSVVLHKRLAQLGEVAGLHHLGEAASKLEQTFMRTANVAARIAAPMAAIVGAAGGFGLAETINKAAELGEKLYNAKLITGLATEQLAAYGYAAREAGVDQGEFNKGLVLLNRGMVDAARGKNLDVAQIFRAMGVSLRDNQGHVIAGATALHQIADEVKYLEESGQGNIAEAMMVKLFGRSGAELIPMFAKGGEQLDKALETARKHGLAPDDAEVGRLRKLHESMMGLRASVEGFGLAIADKMSPHLERLFDRFSAWLDKLRQSKGFNDFMDHFGDALEKVNWQRVGDGLERVGNVLLKIGHFFFGDAENALPNALLYAEIAFGVWSASVVLKLVTVLDKLGLVAERVTKIGKALPGALSAAGASAEAGAGEAVAATAAGAGMGLLGVAGLSGVLGAVAAIVERQGQKYLRHELKMQPGYGAKAEDPGFMDPFGTVPPSAFQGDGPFAGAFASGSVARRHHAAGANAVALPAAARYFVNRGVPDYVARGIAAGAYAESRLDPDAVNPTSGAFGIGQHLGTRQRELFRRYGHHPSAEQQLEFLNWELHGGDPGGAAVLKARNSDEAMRRYIDRFMRPKVGPETEGDIDRGTQALRELASTPLLSKSSDRDETRSRGETRVVIDHRNVPRGIDTRLDRAHPDADVELNVGYAFAL